MITNLRLQEQLTQLFKHQVSQLLEACSPVIKYRLRNRNNLNEELLSEIEVQVRFKTLIKAQNASLVCKKNPIKARL